MINKINIKEKDYIAELNEINGMKRIVIHNPLFKISPYEINEMMKWIKATTKSPRKKDSDGYILITLQKDLNALSGQDFERCWCRYNGLMDCYEERLNGGIWGLKHHYLEIKADKIRITNIGDDEKCITDYEYIIMPRTQIGQEIKQAKQFYTKLLNYKLALNNYQKKLSNELS